eukprot:CAMPEP_0174250690 /NCGR_PEP_ID=MMETSP0439-20130205/786_1 /TAXON_ID=0 /ORGANISM="Stereomyxa ramosa, Strain Chinc5" /LENGTH=184 /DNA_ID=CAMNT_0015330825 /DNA_START=14 /DNA_END=568 /DNA_ORIENTATION=-
MSTQEQPATVSGSGSDAEPPVKKPKKNVHGILVKDKAKKPPKKGIQWDEANLIYNEEHKTATMKIDEPDTPYNFEYDPNESHSDTSDSEHCYEKKEKKVPKSPREEVDPATRFEEISNALSEASATPKVIEGKKEQQEELKEEEKKKAEFNKKRAAHYNEWEMVQKMRQQLAEEEEEEEDESDG